MCIRKTVCLVIVCFLLMSLGAFCQSKEMTKQDPAAIRKLVKVRDGLAVPEDVIKKLIGKILEDNGNLTADFSRGNFIDVAKRLDKRGTSLVTHKYEKLQGKDSAGFWRDSAAGGAVLAVVVDAIFITDVIGTQTVEVCLPEANTNALIAQRLKYDYVASVTQEFHVIETGAVKGNATSFGALVYRHQDICVWE
jgi:hypothetical protein